MVGSSACTDSDSIVLGENSSEAVLYSSIRRHTVSGFPVWDVSCTCLNSWPSPSWRPGACLSLPRACCRTLLACEMFLGALGCGEAGFSKIILAFPSIGCPRLESRACVVGHRRLCSLDSVSQKSDVRTSPPALKEGCWFDR